MSTDIHRNCLSWGGAWGPVNQGLSNSVSPGKIGVVLTATPFLGQTKEQAVTCVPHLWVTSSWKGPDNLANAAAHSLLHLHPSEDQ